MTKESFNKNVEDYVHYPPISSKFQRKPTLSLASVNGRRNSDDASDGYYQQGGSMLNIIIQNNAETDSSEDVEDVAEICSMLSHLGFLSKVFVLDGRQNLKEFFSKLMFGVPSVPAVESRLIHSISNPCNGRYRSEFIEIGIVGKGGFGTVYKVKSTFDHAFYAIKKIKLKQVDNELTEKILHEYTILATLNHQNVIRYHCSWSEINFEEDRTPRYYTPDIPPVITEITNEEELSKLQAHGDEKHGRVEIPETPVRKDSSESETGSFLSDDENNEGQTGGKFWEPGYSTDAETVETKTVSVNESAADKQLERLMIRRPSENLNHMVTKNIFIQMELCSETLEKYLIRRDAKWKITRKDFPVIDGEFNLDVYTQLLSALQYIHHKHIIHRDIKPGNIFLKRDGRKQRVLLGDFGLACMECDMICGLEEEAVEVPEKPKPRTRQCSVHSIGVGTTTYAAPEQLQSSDYGPPVDLYSAGIVFFELYNVFSTGMERMKAIEKLRAGREVTPYMEQKWPSMVPIVMSMTDPFPQKRPTAGQLLTRFKADENETIKKQWDIIHNLKEELCKMEGAIHQKDEELRKQKAKYLELKKRISQSEAAKQ